MTLLTKSQLDQIHNAVSDYDWEFGGRDIARLLVHIEELGAEQTHTKLLKKMLGEAEAKLKSSQDNGKVLVGYLEADRVAYETAIRDATAGHDASYSALKDNRDELMGRANTAEAKLAKALETIKDMQTP